MNFLLWVDFDDMGIDLLVFVEIGDSVVLYGGGVMYWVYMMCYDCEFKLVV